MQPGRVITTAAEKGGDADRNGMGHSGYGCYGLNVAVGNIDDDPQREIIVTEVDGRYPPGGVPAAALVDIRGDARKEIVVSLNDGFMCCFSADAQMIWRFNYTSGKAIMYASEPMVADLNRDGSPEIVFSTYGDLYVIDSGHLVILGADGIRLHDISLPDPGHNGNGYGASAAPTLADLDGDGQLEIMVQTFDHGMDVFTVSDSGCDCLLWTTVRGGPLRMGQPDGMD